MGTVNVKTAAEIEAERVESSKNRVRKKRDKLLRETDHLVMPDYPQTTQGVTEYRQALRDVPQQSGFPDAVEWPDSPL